MKTSQYLSILAVVAIVLAAVLFGLGRLMGPHAYVYDAGTPPDPQARARVLVEATAKLRAIQNLDRRTSFSEFSETNDPDELWPRDRLSIVVAVETYITAKGRVPASLTALAEEGYLSRDLIRAYALTSDGTNWQVIRSVAVRGSKNIRSVVIAKGN